jgi:hypothetical protein
VTIDRVLDADFSLVIKHPAAFTALLPLLHSRFDSFATVRHPIAVLLSWAETPFPIADGHAPAAERLDPELADRLGRVEDVEARQIELLCWFFERFRLLPQGHVLPYEAIIASKGSLLWERTGLPPGPHADLSTRNARNAQAPARHRLAEKLLARGGAYLDHYDAASILAFPGSPAA